MRVGITAWNGRVSPVLDGAERIRIVELARSGEGAVEVVGLSGRTPSERAQEIVSLGLDALICGAVSRPLGAMLGAAGVNVVPWVAGDIEEVLAAFGEGRLDDPGFGMPGCRPGHGRRMRRGGPGGGRGRGAAIGGPPGGRGGRRGGGRAGGAGGSGRAGSGRGRRE